MKNANFAEKIRNYMEKTVCILAGARPNFVKVSPLVRAISKNPEARCLLVYAGCEDDPTLEPSLFDDLQMPRPQYYLGVGSTSLNEITSQVMAAFDRFLDAHPVDVVIVVDDLASTMAAAIVTKKRGIRLAHLVAGTRSFNINMPKEINRLVIDALSDYLFTAGVRFCRPAALPDLQEGSYIVFTLNRKALMADTENLALMLQAMTEAAGDTPIIAPLRGLARETVQKLGAGVQIIEPLSYLEFGWLTAHAKGVITDSGNVSEEATFNSVPCITLNNYTEHQETVSVGSNVLVGEDAGKLRSAVSQMVRGEWKKCALPDRWDGRTAERIVQILLA